MNTDPLPPWSIPTAAGWKRGHMLDRATKEQFERSLLAPYALFSSESRGRAHAEEDDDLRTCWERDRDRIIHCTAFRRLMYKTQVLVNSDGDHKRTRLSHSLEVAQVARSVGSALGLNEVLCETLALSHDIGHPPFGHRGEAALDALMQSRGGFRHNNQVLRVVDLLERRSPDYPGLNLTREVRESLLKNEPGEQWPKEFRPRPARPYLEAQVVDLADSTAYNVHDIEDGLVAGMFTEEDLEQACALWLGARESVELRHPGFLEDTDDRNLRIKRITNELLKICINDLIHASSKRIKRSAPKTAEDVRRMKARQIDHSRPLKREVTQLQKFLHKHFYRHPHLRELSRQADKVLSALFGELLDNPGEMPPWYQEWSEEVGRHRAVCDYLAGMTDRFAQSEFDRLSGRSAPAS